MTPADVDIQFSIPLVIALMVFIPQSKLINNTGAR